MPKLLNFLKIKNLTRRTPRNSEPKPVATQGTHAASTTVLLQDPPGDSFKQSSISTPPPLARTVSSTEPEASNTGAPKNTPSDSDLPGSTVASHQAESDTSVKPSFQDPYRAQLEQHVRDLQPYIQKTLGKLSDTEEKTRRIAVLRDALNELGGEVRLEKLKTELKDNRVVAPVIKAWMLVKLKKLSYSLSAPSDTPLDRLRKRNPLEQLYELNYSNNGDVKSLTEFWSKENNLIDSLENHPNKRFRKTYEAVKNLRGLDGLNLTLTPKPKGDPSVLLRDAELELKANHPGLYTKYCEMRLLQEKMDELKELIGALQKRQKKIFEVLEPLFEVGVEIQDKEHPANRLYDLFHFIEQTFYPENKDVTAYKAAKTRLQQNPFYSEIAACYDQKEVKALIDPLSSKAANKKDFTSQLTSQEENAKQFVNQVEELRKQFNLVLDLRKKAQISRSGIRLRAKDDGKPLMYSDREDWLSTRVSLQPKREFREPTGSTEQAEERVDPALKKQQKLENIEEGVTHNEVYLNPYTDWPDDYGINSKQYVRKRLAEMRRSALP